MAVGRRFRRSGASVSVLLLVAVGLVGLNVLAERAGNAVDLTEGRRLTLSPETGEILDRVDSRLTIDVFVRRDSAAGRDAAALAARYRDVNRHVVLEVVDPDAEPGRAERLGVTRFGTAVLRYEGRRVDVQTVSEAQLTTAILRLVRGTTPTLCAVTGHGEGAVDDEGPRGLTSFAALARRNGFEVVPRTIAVDGLDGCDVVVLAGPRVPLAQGEVAAFVRFLEGAGKALVLADALSEADVNPLIERFGIRFLGGVVLDNARNFNNDASSPVITDFPSANPVVDSVPSLLLPAAAGLLVPDESPREGLHVSTLARTSADAVLAADPEDPSQGGIGGPVVVAAAADESRVAGSPPQILRTRLLVVAGVVFATNTMLDALGNAKLLANGLSWLAQDELLLTVGTRRPADAPLVVTPARRRAVVGVSVVGVPSTVLLLGLVALALRRRR